MLLADLDSPGKEGNCQKDKSSDSQTSAPGDEECDDESHSDDGEERHSQGKGDGDKEDCHHGQSEEESREACDADSTTTSCSVEVVSRHVMLLWFRRGCLVVLV